MENGLYYKIEQKDDSTDLNLIPLDFIAFYICVNTNTFQFITNNHAQQCMTAITILQMRQVSLTEVTHSQSYTWEITGQDLNQVCSLQSPCSFSTSRIYFGHIDPSKAPQFSLLLPELHTELVSTTNNHSHKQMLLGLHAK